MPNTSSGGKKPVPVTKSKVWVLPCSQTNSDNKEPSLVNSAGEFVWSYYLNRICNKARAAPEKLFKDPFPYGKHGFKVGMKLEGIDPEHQAIISVLTVAQLKGKYIT